MLIVSISCFVVYSVVCIRDNFFVVWLFGVG